MVVRRVFQSRHLAQMQLSATRMSPKNTGNRAAPKTPNDGSAPLNREAGSVQGPGGVVRACSIVEPLKLIAVAVAGEGHSIAGTAMIIAAYAASLLIVERLFAIVKPKLLTLPWFARLWEWFVNLRSKLIQSFRAT
jgi:hypothetical protein